MTVDTYRDEGGQWRWRWVARNGRKVAVSGESFDSKRNATRAAARALELAYELMTETIAALEVNATGEKGEAVDNDQVVEPFEGVPA